MNAARFKGKRLVSVAELKHSHSHHQGNHENNEHTAESWDHNAEMIPSLEDRFGPGGPLKTTLMMKRRVASLSPQKRTSHRSPSPDRSRQTPMSPLKPRAVAKSNTAWSEKPEVKTRRHSFFERLKNAIKHPKNTQKRLNVRWFFNFYSTYKLTFSPQSCTYNQSFSLPVLHSRNQTTYTPAKSNFLSTYRLSELPVTDKLRAL